MINMTSLKYTVIKNEEQYYQYCEILEKLVFQKGEDEHEEEIELLTLLIDTWDREHQFDTELDPVQLIKSLMREHGLKQKDLASIAGIRKSTISEILNYKKGLSNNVIRNIASHFNILQESLNKPYRVDEKTVSPTSASLSPSA